MKEVLNMGGRWVVLAVSLLIVACGGGKLAQKQYAPEILSELRQICQQHYAEKGPDHRFESNGEFFYCVSESQVVDHQNYRPAKHPQWKKIVCKELKVRLGDKYQYQPGHTEMQCGDNKLAVAAALDEITRMEKLAQTDPYHERQLNRYRVDAYELAFKAHWNLYEWENALEYKMRQRKFLTELKAFHFTIVAQLYLLMNKDNLALLQLNSAKEHFRDDKSSLAFVHRMEEKLVKLIDAKKSLREDSKDPERLLEYANAIWQLNIYYSSVEAKKQFLNILNYVIQSKTKVAKAYFLRAKYWLAEGERIKANRDLNSSLHTGINDLANIYDIANFHRASNNPVASLRAANQFLKVSPDERAYLLIAHANFDLARFEQASKAYNKALELDRNPRTQVSGLGSIEHDTKWLQRRAFIQYTQGDFERAINGLSKAIEQQGGDYNKYVYRAVVLNEMSRFHAAQKDLLVFTAKLPSIQLTNGEYGDYYQAMGDNEYGLGDVGKACAHWEYARQKWKSSVVTSRQSLLKKINEFCQ